MERVFARPQGEPEDEDAKFMPVICSVFANYLTEKARKRVLMPV